MKTNAKSLIHERLTSCEAVTHNRIVRDLHLEDGIVQHELAEMVKTGRVEIIRPVGEDNPQAGRDYYRLIRNTDSQQLPKREEVEIL